MSEGGRGLHPGLWRRSVAEVGFTLVTLGIVLLAFVAYDLWGTSFAERHDQAMLARQFGSAVATARHAPSTNDNPTVSTPTVSRPTVSRPTGSRPERGRSTTTTLSGGTSPRKAGPGRSEGGQVVPVDLPVPGQGVALARIVIPAIGVDRYVVQGVDEGDLEMGPGHYPGTPLPGHLGNVGIAGHRTTFGAPFFELGRLERGDMVYITDTTGWTWGYMVQRSFVVLPTDVAVLGSLPGAELTLTTCNPPFEATTRLIVRAQLANRFPPGQRVTALPVREAHAPASGAALAVAPGSPLPTTTRTTGATVPETTVPGPAEGTAPIGQPAGGKHGSGTSKAPAGVPVPRTGGALGGAVLWGSAAAVVWLLARLLAARVVGRNAPTRRRRHWEQAGTLVLGAAVAAVPLWSCFANIVQLLPPNF